MKVKSGHPEVLPLVLLFAAGISFLFTYLPPRLLLSGFVLSLLLGWTCALRSRPHSSTP